MPTSGTVGSNRSVTHILVDQEEELIPAASMAVEAPHASAITLKNAKAPPIVWPPAVANRSVVVMMMQGVVTAQVLDEQPPLSTTGNL